MKLPNGDRAVVEIGKLRDYCLSHAHSRGRHKARVFQLAAGLTERDAERLRQVLLEAALTREAVLGKRDRYGQRYILDFPMPGLTKLVTIRSCWLVRAGEDNPRLSSCYVL